MSRTSVNGCPANSQNRMTSKRSVPVLGFAARSGTGKTTLLVRLLPLLKARGLRVGMIKHAHHDFEIDYPGKDSYELRHAGASQMLVGSRQRWALIAETPDANDPDLPTCLERLDSDNLDLILVEGFKPESIPKIELHRVSLGQPLMYDDTENIIAVAHDAAEPLAVTCAQLDINAPEAIAAFIVDRFISPADNRLTS